MALKDYFLECRRYFLVYSMKCLLTCYCSEFRDCFPVYLYITFVEIAVSQNQQMDIFTYEFGKGENQPTVCKGHGGNWGKAY